MAESIERKANKKEIVITRDMVISYDNENCYINGEKISSKKEESSKNSNGDIDNDPKKIANEEKLNFYNSLFKHHFQNIVILAAAGTSLDNNFGKTRIGLWEECKDEIDAFQSDIKEIKNKPFYKSSDIEGLLSYLILYQRVHEASKEFSDKLDKLETKIAKLCKLELQNGAPHKLFLDKITARKPSDSRVQLFTTNYDTLFEQAAQRGGFVVIDGFSFTQPRTFSGRYFDYDIVNRERTRLKQEDNFISKVFHLYKLHGSLNWKKDGNKIIQHDSPEKPLIIYPASTKYESSYEQPYFEMMSRFQQALRKENVLLVVIGFGFRDKHIQNVILEAVNQNPSFQLVIINYHSGENASIIRKELKDFFEDSECQMIKRNITIIFDTFKDFSNHYPDNKTYSDIYERYNNETI